MDEVKCVCNHTKEQHKYSKWTRRSPCQECGCFNFRFPPDDLAAPWEV